MIVLYHGARGCGKTTTLVKDAIAFQHYGWKIITNMTSLKIECEILDENEILDLVNGQQNNFVLVIDEIQTLINSRRSGRDQNVSFQYFIQQIRKRNVVILATTQYIIRVDKSFREHVDIDVAPKFIKEYPVVLVTYSDLTKLEEGIEEGAIREIAYNPEPIYPYFDTTEVIKPVKSKSKTIDL